MSARASVLALSIMIASWPVTSSAFDRQYEGICEASAAAKIDATHVAIASDDYKSIITYERGNTKKGPESEIEGVTDIEAAAEIDGTIFWLASYSLNSDGEDKSKRKVLFATTVNPDRTLKVTGEFYQGLRADIAKALGRTDECMMPNFNIEGMAQTPSNHIIVGLRGPQTMPGDRAILVEITNPFDLIKKGAKRFGVANVSQVTTLDLSDGPDTAGRGVRDLALVDNRYLIVAGSEPDGGKPPPKLFWWDGHSDNVSPGPTRDFSQMTPEAIVVWNKDAGEIFSDNGENGTLPGECDDKHPPKDAKFPAVDVNF